MRKADAQLLSGLERALEKQQLYMAYQPKVSLRDGSLKRVEALVRWEDPELGTVEPSRFIPVAEQHGLIDALTQWGLRTALRQWLEWREQGIDTSIVHARNDIYTVFGGLRTDLPNLDRFDRSYIALPCHMAIDEEAVTYITDTIRAGW